MTITLSKFKEIFGDKFPELVKEQLISRKEACIKAASLFPPYIGKEIMSDYYSVLPEYKNDHFESIAHMFADDFNHYGLRQMIEHAEQMQEA